MKKLTLFLTLLLSFFASSCGHSSSDVWEDTKTASRYLQRKSRLLWTKDVDSCMLESVEDFNGPVEEEFIILKDEDLKTQFADLSIAQPKHTPGDKGSPIPGIEQFVKPTSDLKETFSTLFFETNEHILREKHYYQGVYEIAEYMKKNPNLYIFIEGHCDERASEAYNLALGTRRANTIRNLLIKKGVNANNVYTISYGKEMPADSRGNKEAWAKNRRVEFKIFQK